MTVIDVLRNYHAQGIGAVKVAALPALTGMSQIKIDAEVLALTKSSQATNKGGYMRLAAPPVRLAKADQPEPVLRRRCRTCGRRKNLEKHFSCSDSGQRFATVCKECEAASKDRFCDMCWTKMPANHAAPHCSKCALEMTMIFGRVPEGACGAWP